MTEESRLIEEFLPVGAISREAIREKSAGRDYHPSTLHWWWARRPLAAARAAVLAALVPRAMFPAQREDIEGFFSALSAWEGNEVGLNQAALDRARRLVSDAWGNSPPRVIDTFAGGGAIPLEAIRLGASVTAVELNPVAYIVGLGTIVWPQRYGASLADDVQRWANWVGEETKADVGDLYPPIKLDSAATAAEQLSLDGARRVEQLSLQSVPLAYLWTRTVRCPNPLRLAHNVPLIRSGFVVRKPGKAIKLRVVPDPDSGTFKFELVSIGEATAVTKRGKSSASACPMCGASVTAEYLKARGDAGQIDHQLVAVVHGQAGKQGKHYMPADAAVGLIPNGAVMDQRLAALEADGLSVPNDLIQPMGNAGLASGETYLYGIRSFADVFTKRQLVTLLTMCKHVRRARELMREEGLAGERADCVAAYLGMIVNRVVDRSTALCRWNLIGEKAESPFIRDRLAMLWDFVEVNPFAGISGDYFSAIESVTKVIRHCARTGAPADLRRASATDLPFSNGTFDAAIVDPPYYDNISYANSSDFYYVWLKRSIGHLFPEHFAGPVAPKRNEIVAAAYHHNNNKELAKRHYEDLMTQAFKELQRVLKPAGALVVVYAHQTTAGWSTLIQSLRRAGFTVSEAWPLDTERAERRGGQENASLASSIFLVARRRETEEVGSWAAVETEFAEVIAERIQTLPKLGITGADLVIATIGAGLRPYTKFQRVELSNGQPMEPDAYLDEVQSAVVKTILAELMGVSRSGVEGVDPVTQLYVIGRFEYGDAFVPFDEMNTLVHGILAGARGRGVELLGPRGLAYGAGALVEQEKESVRLRDYDDRGAVDSIGLSRDGHVAPLIDVLHRLLWLADNEPLQVKDYLSIAQPDASRLRLVAQALSGSRLSEKGSGTSAREQAAISRLLASWKRLIDDTLFAVKS